MAAAYMGSKIEKLYQHLDKHLADRGYLGREYSIADIGILCHIAPRRLYAVVDSLDAYPGLKSWYQRLRARPAVRRGFALDPEVLEQQPEDFRRRFLDEA